MKVLEKNLKKGFVKVVPETLDDLWHLYNIIYKEDLVCARTTREVKVDADYARPQKGKRVSVFLTLRVENISWDRSLNRLRVQGEIREAPESIAGRGSHHTFKIAVNKPLTIIKDKWLKHQINRLERARRSKTPSIIVVSIDNEEFCIAMIREYGVDVKVQSKARLPSKLEAEKRANALRNYFKQALNALKVVWQNRRLSTVIIGVGFTKKQFAKYVRSEASDVAQAIVDVKSVNSSGVAGIKEALRSGVLSKALKHLRIVEETSAVEEVLARLGKEKRTVAYGLTQVEKAETFGAIETLLVADSTIRDASDEERLTLETLMRKVEEKDGKVVIVSVENEAGQKTLALGGVAALLRFPVQ